jgi:hypothetical protein
MNREKEYRQYIDYMIEKRKRERQVKKENAKHHLHQL